MNKELLEKLKNAKTDEERKQIIEENKTLLADEGLEQVSGGLLSNTTLAITPTMSKHGI